MHASDEDMAAVARRCTTCRSMLPQDRFEGRRLRCRACVGRRHSGVGVKKKVGVPGTEERELES